MRVVNNVDKVQEVKANFHDAFKTDGFPASLPYRQKVQSLRLGAMQPICWGLEVPTQYPATLPLFLWALWFDGTVWYTSGVSTARTLRHSV